MATTNSDDSTSVPKDFQLSSSLDSGSRISPNYYRCQLCNNYRKVFYCKECVHNGDIYKSSSQCPERYADKQIKLLQLKAARKAVEDNCLDKLERKQKIDVLGSKIRQSRDRIEILRLSLKDRREKQKTYKAKIIEIIGKNEKLTKSLPKYEERVEKLGLYVASRREDNQRLKDKILNEQAQLQNVVKTRIQQLVQYIFPISIVLPKIEIESGEVDMVTALAEATRTTYISNQWVYNDNSGELQYCIVAPTLPGSGNYSSYNIWVAQNKDAVPGSSSTIAVDHNPAYSISAALTYTAQLISIIAFYLDVRLPYRMSYSDFCSSDMPEQQFSRRVARLNANILHLCFTQNTSLNSLHPTRTLHNILQLLDTNITDLGRGPIEADTQMALDLEDQIANDLQTSEDSDSEEGDSFPCEWEAVPHIQCPEVPAGPVNLPLPTQMTSTQQASSVAGGLVTSAANSIVSIWKGWTGR
ncbi:beclin 1-associated autophagy-related key regulator-like isoform X2 [Agrilus planipennis]|uniref:Beclin 1-associated autophagy-related key regulator isoform X2 n=1 Tax=Agrilus planipennis TaxID=224129 RepID=A0A7F5RBY5_AGRPL|nr:beclin 1-associated autophagy-related key regulator isoform X2 [Agrilus planipennis]XP_025833483.1 beclin 1-associated autophagy-related key regulator-like isoform X2 [Agrilus planipennis]